MMLTVATWNLENLFRPAAAAGQDAYARKLDALASMIERLGPDVLAVQEVGDPLALDDLVARLPGDWHSVLSPDPDGRGIRVGFLARHELSDIERIGAVPGRHRPRPRAGRRRVDDADGARGAEGARDGRRHARSTS